MTMNAYGTPKKPRALVRRSIPIVAGTLVALVACSEESSPPIGTEVPLDPASFLSDSMPPWDVYSPLLASSPPAPAGPDSVLPEVVLAEVEHVNEAGGIDTLTNQTYVCTETPYSVTDTPERLVMYSPDASLLWAGGLIQGRSHKELGSLEGLKIDERAPVTIVIDGVLGVPGGVTRVVTNPSFSAVADSVNNLVGSASTDDLETASDIVFKMRTFHSEREAGLGLGASGRYLGFSAAASYDSNISESETTVVAEFYEKMFTIVIDPPSTPAGFFTDDLTGELLRTKYAGKISSENPPLYISEVVYGRSLMYSMTSTASASEIQATMNATFRSITGGASVNLSARQETLLRESKISVVALGGPASNALNLIQSNNLAAYFEDGAPLTSARPLSYTFRTLEGQAADVSETTSYTLRTCEPKGTGRVTFLDPQTATAPIGGAFTSVAGDFDGDSYGDLLWNQLSGGTNQFFIGHGQPDGTFDIGPAIVHPDAAGGVWGLYDVTVADLDGNGIDDLVWNATTASFNTTYTALATGGGSFTFPAASAFPGGGGDWSDYDAVVGDFDGDGYDDIAWSRTYSGGTMMNFGEGNGDGTFTLTSSYSISSNSGFVNYRPAVAANFDNDAADEIVLQSLTGNANTAHLVEMHPTSGQLALGGYVTRTQCCWDGYSFRVANVDGVQGADLVYWGGGEGIHSNRANGITDFGQPRFVEPPPAYQVLLDPPTALTGYQLHVGDMNEDGRDDLIFNNLDNDTNELVIAYGASSFEVSVPAGVLAHQAPPTGGWDLYETRIVDVNGDGKDDVVWAIPQGDLTIHVGLAR